MKIHDYTKKDFFLTFAIGFIAGITPFAFTRVLPMMLRPEEFVPMQTLHLWVMVGGMAITGVIVGAIVALMYAGAKDETSPKEVFLYALGIPAILIATVSNLTTDIKAKSEISAMQETANAVNALSSPDAVPPSIPEQSYKPFSDAGGDVKSGFLLRSAYAAPVSGTTPTQTPQDPYLVIIGTYTSRDEAKSVFEQYMNRKFRSEAYVQKHLELLELPGNPTQYVIVYARFRNPSDAARASRYLQINDRDLMVSLAKQAP